MAHTMDIMHVYRVSQEERSIFWEVIISVILSKKSVYKYMCPVPNGFQDRAVSLYSSTNLLIRKRYYVLFLIPVFIVQVTKSVEFTQYNTFPKITLTSHNFVLSSWDTLYIHVHVR
jgi:hypothetical protein